MPRNSSELLMSLSLCTSASTRLFCSLLESNLSLLVVTLALLMAALRPVLDPLDRSLTLLILKASMCTPASHWSLYSSFPSSGIYLLIPMIASHLDLLSLPRISHNTLFLNDLPYKQLRPISGVTPLPFAHSKLLPKISPTGPSHLQLSDIQLLSYLQKVKYCILNVG